MLPASKQCCETNLPLLYPQRIQEAPRLASVRTEAVIGDHEDFYPDVDPNNFNSPHMSTSSQVHLHLHFHDLPSFSYSQHLYSRYPSWTIPAFQANFRPNNSGQVALAEAASSWALPVQHGLPLRHPNCGHRESGLRPPRDPGHGSHGMKMCPDVNCTEWM